MAPLPPLPSPPENIAFLKELQCKENRSQDEFLAQLPDDRSLGSDHIALQPSLRGGRSALHNNQAPNRDFRSPRGVDDPEIYRDLSLNLWKRINAGYIIPKRPPRGVTHATYTYDPSLVEKQSLEYHRKRDFYSEYNEVAARFKLVLGNKKPLRKPPKGKERSKSPPGSSEKIEDVKAENDAGNIAAVTQISQEPASSTSVAADVAALSEPVVDPKPS